MVNKNKIKGSRWEHDVVEILNEKVKGADFHRIAGSGAMGTTMNEPLLTGDVAGSIESFYKKFRIECKVGYGGETQFTLKKDWLDKIRMEANLNYSFPLLIGKFLGSRSGVKHFVVMDMDVFVEFLNEYTSLKEDLDKILLEK